MRGSKIPEEDFNHFKQQLERDTHQYYLLIREKNAENKVCLKSSLSLFIWLMNITSGFRLTRVILQREV